MCAAHASCAQPLCDDVPAQGTSCSFWHAAHWLAEHGGPGGQVRPTACTNARRLDDGLDFLRA
eukprot:365823-Chlamydomonas_euryale.AAC.11